VAATAGDGALAEWAAGRLDTIAEEIDRALYKALAGIGGAWSALAAGDADRAAITVGEAVALLSASNCRAFLGRALDVLGQSLAGRDPAAAASALEQAAGTFEACGATWRRNRSLDALRRLSE
jgi:hypothetical protein